MTSFSAHRELIFSYVSAEANFSVLTFSILLACGGAAPTSGLARIYPQLTPVDLFGPWRHVPDVRGS